MDNELINEEVIPEIEPEGGIEPEVELELDGEGNPVQLTGFQKRINQLTKRRSDAEKEAAYWKGVAESRGQAAPVVATQAPEVEPELDPIDFDSDADFLKAVAKQIENKITAKAEKEEQLKEAKQRSQEILTAAKQARTKYSDFDDVALNPSVPVTQHMFDAAMGSNLGDVLYYLGKNPVEAKKIAALPPVQQAKAIGRIEATIKLPIRKVSEAPTPPTTLKGSGVQTTNKNAKTRAELHAEWEVERRKKLGIK